MSEGSIIRWHYFAKSWATFVAFLPRQLWKAGSAGFWEEVGEDTGLGECWPGAGGQGCLGAHCTLLVGWPANLEWEVSWFWRGHLESVSLVSWERYVLSYLYWGEACFATSCCIVTNWVSFRETYVSFRVFFVFEKSPFSAKSFNGYLFQMFFCHSNVKSWERKTM